MATSIADSFLTTQASLALAQGQTSSPPMPTADRAAAKAAAQNFEAVFVSQMFGQMFQNVGTNSLFGGGHGEEMFRSMLIDEYGKLVAKRGGLGISDAVMRTLVSQQEKSQ